MIKKFFAIVAILFVASVGYSQNGMPIKIKDVRIEVIGGGGIAAVQPYAMVKFKTDSCLERKDLAIVKDTSEQNVSKITILDMNGFDCFGASITREYTLQISSDASFESYIILNPIAPDFK